MNFSLLRTDDWGQISTVRVIIAAPCRLVLFLCCLLVAGYICWAMLQKIGNELNPRFCYRVGQIKYGVRVGSVGALNGDNPIKCVSLLRTLNVASYPSFSTCATYNGQKRACLLHLFSTERNGRILKFRNQLLDICELTTISIISIRRRWRQLRYFTVISLNTILVCVLSLV